MHNRYCTCAILSLIGMHAWTPGVAQPLHPPTDPPRSYESLRDITVPHVVGTPSSVAGSPPSHEEEAEKVFWDCEGTSKVRVLNAGDAAVCSVAYETLLKKKFRGDFSALMTWWGREKPYRVTGSVGAIAVTRSERPR